MITISSYIYKTKHQNIPNDRKSNSIGINLPKIKK